MNLRRLLLSSLVLGIVLSATLLGQEKDPVGTRMTEAAEKWLALLNDDQKGKAIFPFDSPERSNWFFIPLQDKANNPTRKGLRLEKMTAEQKEAARSLVAAGTSGKGYAKVIGIMSLESILRELEATKVGGLVRNPEWYFFTVFGSPSKTGKWGWRVEGHHLSLNFTVDRGKVVSATPYFLGANPAELRTGPKKGLRTLPEAEGPPRQLLEALSAEQKTLALQPKQFEEIEQGKTKPNVGPPVGLPAAKMDDKQKGILRQLLQGYADRMPAEVGTAEMARVMEAGLDKVHFALARDEDKPGKPFSYRVQGPTFVIEFLNIQNDSAGNPANHIHSSWRNLEGDFGLVAR